MHITLKNFTFLILISCNLSAQSVKDFFYVEKEKKELPVLVKGNLAKKTILLYVSGSYGDNSIDFARADYPNWKNTLEKEVAIAYYDKRGLPGDAEPLGRLLGRPPTSLAGFVSRYR